MRVLPIILVGSSALSTTFAQSYGPPNGDCTNADQNVCCDMTNDGFHLARSFCVDHGCNQNICSGKPSGGSGYHDDDDDLWGSGGATQWGHDDDVDWSPPVDTWGAPQTKSWGGGTQQWGDWGTGWGSDGHPTFSPTLSPTLTPTLSPVWSAPKYDRQKSYYPPTPYYPPPATLPAPKPYYPPPPPAPKFVEVETCCTTGADACPMEFRTEKQSFFSGSVRVCCGRF